MSASVKSLVIRAIELLELAQLGSALMISVCTGRLFSQKGWREFMKRVRPNAREGKERGKLRLK